VTIAIPDVVFDPKRVEDAELFGMNFARLLPTGDTITSAVVTSTLVEGRGMTGNMIITPAVISGTWVRQIVSGGTKGARYHLRFTANTSGGLKLTGVGELQVVD